MRNLFNKVLISSNNQPAIQEFSRKFVTKEKLVIQYVKHLEELNFEKTMRAERKQKQVSEESESDYSDYNWKELFESNKLRHKTRKVTEKIHFLSQSWDIQLQKDIINAIIAHICTSGTMANPQGGGTLK